MVLARTTQKGKACEKTVYLVDQLTADNSVYHKSCFRCQHCNETLKVLFLFSVPLLFGLVLIEIHNLVCSLPETLNTIPSINLSFLLYQKSLSF
jgi:hypothetical protein